jgi:class 3 adenylate cyclase
MDENTVDHPAKDNNVPALVSKPELGYAQAPRRTDPEVTVLFADVKRSTELAEQVDPEDWHNAGMEH